MARAPARDRLDAIVDLSVGPRVLHIGCGGARKVDKDPVQTRWLHGLLSREFDEVWGIDTNGPGVERLRASGFENLHLMAAEDLELNTTFDTIVAGEVIEHLVDPGSFLRRISDHLKPDGRLVLSTPFAFSVGYMVYAWLKWPKTCSNDDHKMWFCPSTLSVLAGRSGLTESHLELTLNYAETLPADRPFWQRNAYKIWRSMMVNGTRLSLIPTRMTGNSMVMVLRPT